MAITDLGGIGNVASRLVSGVAMGGLIIVGLIILGGIILGIGFWIRYNSQFIYKVEIRSRRSSGLSNVSSIKIIEDKGAFIRNKKEKTVYFRLKNQGVDLLPPPLECIQLGLKGRNYVKIYQASDEEFYYLLPDEVSLVDGKNNEKLAETNAKVISGDAAFWNSVRKRENRKMFDTEGLIMKLLPYIVPVLMFMLVIFMTYMVMDKWQFMESNAKLQLQVVEKWEKIADKLAGLSYEELQQNMNIESTVDTPQPQQTPPETNTTG